MRNSLAAFFSSFRRPAALPIAIGISFVGLLVGAVLLRWQSEEPRPAPVRQLSPRAKDMLREKAREMAPQANLFSAYVLTRSKDFADQSAEELDEDEILQFSREVVAWSDGFVGEFRSEIDTFSEAEGVDAKRVQKYFSEQLRECADEGEALPIMIPCGGAGPLGILFSPRLSPPLPGKGPELAKEDAIKHLLQVFAKLPLQSKGARGILNAIKAIRQALIPFDTKPISITFNTPAPDVIVTFIPSIDFEMTDAGSGPDPDSRKLEAINSGPIIQQTVDLTPFTQVTVNDQVNGIVQVTTTTVPGNAIKDGFIELRASGTDFAGNPPAVATRNIVLDRQPPTITITSPEEGEPFPSATAPLRATVIDLVSGVNQATVQVFLNSTNITDLVDITPGNTTTIEGILIAQSGSNELTILASDNAGNPATATVNFTTEAEPELPKVLTLEIVSGDGQKGLPGRCIEEDLVVRVFDVNTGESVPSVFVSFGPIEGDDGFSVPTPNGASVSGSDGRAFARYRLSRSPGIHNVKARIVPAPQGTGTDKRQQILEPGFVLFNLESTPPTLKDIFTPSSCNLKVSTKEFAGSALSVLMKIQFLDHEGQPKEGEMILPEVTDAKGKPISPKVGDFLPTRAVTDANGTATFAFVIDLGAPVGPFKMNFLAPPFFDTTGQLVSVSVDGEVRDPKFRGDQPQINSGQGQVGLPNQELMSELSARDVRDPPFAIDFTIIEGSGTFRRGTEGDGAALDFGNACGEIFEVFVDGDGNGSVFFTLNEGETHALIALDPVVTDVFAVGPPEVRFVRASDPTTEVPVIQAFGVAPDLASSEFLMESRLPLDFNESLVGEILSLDRCSNKLEMPSPIGLLSADNIEFEKVSSGSKFATFRSTTRFSSIQGIKTEDTPTLPQTDTFLQLAFGGSLQPKITACGLVFLGMPLQDKGPVPVLRRAVVGIDQGGEISPGVVKGAGKNKDIDKGGYKWEFTLPDGTKPSITTSMPQMHFGMVRGDTQIGGAKDGSEVDKQVELHFDVKKENRRATMTVKFTALAPDGTQVKGADPLDLKILLSTGKSNVADLPSDEDFQKLEQVKSFLKTKDVKDAQGNPFWVGIDKLDKAAKDVVQKDTGEEDPFKTTIVRFFRKLGNTSALVSFATLYTYFQGDPQLPGKFTQTPVGVAVYGFRSEGEFDKEDFPFIVQHELEHLKLAFGARGITVEGMTPRDALIGQLQRDAFQFAHDAGLARPPKAPQESFTFAARVLDTTIGEIEVYFRTVSLALTNPKISHHFLQSELEGLVDHHGALMMFLSRGLIVPKAPAGFFLEITDKSLRARLINYAREIYNKIPDELKRIRLDGEIDLRKKKIVNLKNYVMQLPVKEE